MPERAAGGSDYEQESKPRDSFVLVILLLLLPVGRQPLRQLAGRPRARPLASPSSPSWFLFC